MHCPDPARRPPLTVVVPAYNRLDLLRPVLEGFLREAQAEDFELVLVDDGSQPPAAPLLAELGAPPSFRAVTHATNRGRGAAVNTGVAEARGEVVVVCDSDIVPQPGFVAEHLAFHREHPAELATHLGALEWGVDAGLYGALMGARNNPRMTALRGAVDWTLWYTDQWSFKRSLLASRGLAFDEGYRTWGWEDLDLARKLAALGATCAATGRARGLHLKPATLEGSLRNFALSAVNLLKLARSAPADPHVREWLSNRFHSERALHAAEAFVRSTWERCAALDAEARARHGLSLSEDDVAPRLALALSDAVFAVGLARGLEDAAEAGEVAGLPWVPVGSAQAVVDLARLAACVYVAGTRLADEGQAYALLQEQVAALIEGAQLSPEEARVLWQSLEAHAVETASSLRPRTDEQATAAPAPAAEGGLELSVVVPTYGRPERIRALLERLDGQTLAPERFEVIVVDDGSPEPIEVESERHAYALELLRQDNAGPGAARNLAFERCRAPLVLILNDDAVPAPDLLAGHLAAHAQLDGHTAVLGTFPFTARALRSPFVQLLQATDLLFDFPRLRHGQVYDWRYFWTCNISLPLERLREVDGFDAARFREAIVEDVELGYRLEQRGVRVLHRADLCCEHDHVLEPAGYARRMHRLGVNLARMYAKHGDPRMIWGPPERALMPRYLRLLQDQCEACHGVHAELNEKLARLEEDFAGRQVPQATLGSIHQAMKRVGILPFYAGVLEELEGHDPFEVLERGPAAGRLTSLVVVAHQALDQTRRCLEALRAAREDAHPVELLFVDNGSTDGTAEYLAQQPDVRLIRNAANLGAPRARNQALVEARGAYVVFLDNDVMVTPGWLPRLLFHAEVDGRSGAVSCLADRARGGQQLDVPPLGDARALARFADGLAREAARQRRPAVLLSSFLMLVRREVLDTIGGFDEGFSPWGFEDDDFSLRAHLAGFRNRVALDVFVRHEAYGGPKAERHEQLLQRNWRRFVEKWGLPADAPYGDLSQLGAVEARAWSHDELRVDVPGWEQQVGAALPGERAVAQEAAG